ncbi:hypothetical protein [Profundibacter amoris]|uniref:Uncharacterized protein n=1 Tax=Profundibacter amoris TaxID=2171755 RepID=A0A347UGW5_9RHOB|nr:hypothetical protein [Profundibacter amoris]AXX98093.1 hypothetical protein BAR1_09200 [Profundibacter amoris]
MTSLTKEVKDLFKPRGDLFDLRREAAKILGQEEWAAYKKQAEKFDGERRYVKRAYELEYPHRFAKAQRRLINEAGSVKRRLVYKVFGSDAFDKGEINRRAQMNVRGAHNNDLAQIDQREGDVLRSMLSKAQKRSVQREKPIKDFQKAVDRRSGMERRVRSWSR